MQLQCVLFVGYDSTPRGRGACCAELRRLTASQPPHPAKPHPALPVPPARSVVCRPGAASAPRNVRPTMREVVWSARRGKSLALSPSHSVDSAECTMELDPPRAAAAAGATLVAAAACVCGSTSQGSSNSSSRRQPAARRVDPVPTGSMEAESAATVGVLDCRQKSPGYWDSPWPVECGGPRRQKLVGTPGLALRPGEKLASTTRPSGGWPLMFIQREPGQLYLQCCTRAARAASCEAPAWRPRLRVAREGRPYHARDA